MPRNILKFLNTNFTNGNGATRRLLVHYTYYYAVLLSEGTSYYVCSYNLSRHQCISDNKNMIYNKRNIASW